MLIWTETIQWSEMNPCSVVLIMSKQLLSCVKIKSRVFPLTCVGPEMCCSRPSAFMVSLKMTASTSVRSSIWILQSPSMMLFWYWGSLLTSNSVMSSQLFYYVPHLVVNGKVQRCVLVYSWWYISILHTLLLECCHFQEVLCCCSCQRLMQYYHPSFHPVCCVLKSHNSLGKGLIG